MTLNDQKQVSVLGLKARFLHAFGYNICVSIFMFIYEYERLHELQLVSKNLCASIYAIYKYTFSLNELQS
jgi:hypothetical protein